MSHFKKISLFFLMILILFSFHTNAFSLTGKSAMNQTGKAVSGSVKGIGKIVTGTGEGIYKVLEYILTELVRPIRPITNKMVDWFGVEVDAD